MPRIIPLRTGWGPGPGDSTYYPHDLPQDWQLAYFANACWGVLVPQPLWCDAGAAGASDWAAETPARFRFFLDLATPVSPSMLAAVVRAFGDRLGGLVMSGTLSGVPVGAGVARRCRAASAAQVRGAAEGVDGFAYEVPPDLIPDLRRARRWIEERVCAAHPPNAAEPAAALLGHCALADLERWQTLVELMGLA
ncbi:MAG: hypothetical protein WAM94_20615 [Chromatiaceae bacterium]